MTAQELNHEKDSSEDKKREDKAILSRFLLTILFVFLGWLSIWVLAAVIIIQFGFMIFDEAKNDRLNQFAGQVINYQKEILKYIAMQTEKKPFPFAGWPEKEVAETE